MIDKKELSKKIASFSTASKPKINPNLKIRSMTDPEIAMSEVKKRYQKNGKTTFMGAARMIGDVGKKMFRRSFLGED